MILLMGGSPGDVCSFSKLSVTLPTSQLILQPFRRFTYVTAHSQILPLLHLRHSSFSNPSFASPTSQALHLIYLASQQSSFSNLPVASPSTQLIIQPFRCFTYVTVHSPALPSLYLLYVTAHSPTLSLVHLRHNSFSNPSVALPTSQLIFNPSVASPTLQFILQPIFLFS